MGDFKYFEETLNSRKRKINCSENRLCKRMECGHCRLYRRSSFIRRGLRHMKINELNKFVTVSWPNKGLIIDDKWSFLTSTYSALAKTLSGRGGGPFIRVISLGKCEDTPHVHYILNLTTSLLVRKIVKKKWADSVVVQIKDVREDGEEGLLGYFFDQNFIPAHAHPGRVKRTRVLSASRPMKCGFPYLARAKADLSKPTVSDQLCEFNLESSKESISVSHSGN